MRLDLTGSLPDRCIACNQPADGYRLRRKLYSSPALWKTGAFLAPFAALVIGIWLNSELLMASFWPLAILLAIAHLFVRRSFRVEYGVCRRHRRLRYTLIACSIAAMAGVFAGIFGFRTLAGAPLLLVGSLLALLILVVLQSSIGVQALTLRGVSKEHAWLSGTGATFRSTLPELN